jgi:hypothetical protein
MMSETPKAELTLNVCGGKQAQICPVTKRPHDMSVLKVFKDGGSVACRDCGVTAMDLDLMEMP